MGARSRISMQTLDEANLAKGLRALLPRKNNFCSVNYGELICELREFGVRTRGDLRRLILRNLRDAVAIDAEPLDAINTRIYRAELGDRQFAFLERRQIFFGWEGLMRLILELEFGDEYREFANKRLLTELTHDAPLNKRLEGDALKTTCAPS